MGPFSGLQIDLVNPTVTCDAAPTGWQAADVSVACAGADADSGLASPGDAGFSLTTSVPAGVETASATTDSRNVCDVAGNCVSAGPLSGIMVDRAAPAITLTTPSDGAVYPVGAAITASYACADGGSGVAGCVGDIANGAALDTTTPGPSTFTVTATDAVGNVSSRVVNYTVGGHMAVASITFQRVPCAASAGFCLQAWVRIESNDQALPGAAVEVRFSTPAGSATMVAASNRYGVATFTTPLGAAGQYAIAVTNVTAPGYDYTPTDNAVTSRAVTMGTHFR